MWVVSLEVAEGEHRGHKFTSYLSFSEKALAMTKQTLERVCPELLEQPFDPADDAASDRLVGVEVDARVNRRMYDGEVRNQVRRLSARVDENPFL